MPQILTTNALVTCPHLGVGSSTATDPKWLIRGGAVLLDNDFGTIVGCQFQPVPCLSYQLNSLRLNATQVGTRNVMLVTDFTVSDIGFRVARELD